MRCPTSGIKFATALDKYKTLSASNRNEYQESSWGKGRPARGADNLTAICEPIV
jgi:hypothetical protein